MKQLIDGSGHVVTKEKAVVKIGKLLDLLQPYTKLMTSEEKHRLEAILDEVLTWAWRP